MKPSVFIGCARESLEVAYALQEELEYDAEVTVWPQSIFRPSSNTLEELTKQLHRFDFGIFVTTPDDSAVVRGEPRELPRDNVILELGMFIGRLGRERCFIIAPRGDKKLRIPSDLLGLAALEYDPQRLDGNIQAALGPACNKIRKEIKSRGLSRVPKSHIPAKRMRRSDFSKATKATIESHFRKITEEIHQTGEPACILFADLDKFSSLNRWYGEEVCDEVIRMVEEAIRTLFEENFCIRISGDQFLLCLVGVTVAQARRQASRLVEDIQGRNWSKVAPNLHVTISVGIADYKPGRSLDEWIVRALHGAVSAKKTGGNRASRGPIELEQHLMVRYELMLS